MGQAARISILIPVRTTDIEFVLERLAMRDRLDLSSGQVILTDDGSPDSDAEVLRRECEKRGWTYRRLETADRPFSLARARNDGLSAADSDYVVFDDLDMAYSSGFFGALVEELAILERLPIDFLSLPVLYLSAESTKRVFAAGSLDEIDRDLVASMLFEDPRGAESNTVIDHFAPASAILALPAATARAIGGFDERFEGWGGEDRDFIFRLLAANDALPLPADFTATRVGNLADLEAFEGWRSLFRLHGDYCARKGLYGFHLHHAPHEWRTDRSNIDLAARKAKALEGAANRATTDAHRLLRRSTLFSAFPHANGDPAPGRRTSGPGRLSSRLRKLKRDPHRFFRDSNLPFSNLLSRLFAPRKDVV